METLLQKLVGYEVNSECGIRGVVEYVKGVYLGVRGPNNRLDEIDFTQVWIV